MKVSTRFLEMVAVSATVALVACGGSADLSPVAATTTGADDAAVLTSSGNGPGAPPAAAPGTGTCTQDCDGTGHGPGPGNGSGPGAGTGYGPGPRDGLCGNTCAGPVGPDPDDMKVLLVDALQEEYKAEMLYRSVLEDFPGAMPFAVIAESEGQHVAALQALFTRRGTTPPSSIWGTESFESFGSIAAACAAGVEAETEDAAFYTPYLQRDDLPQDVRNVFTNLQRASLENHLPAFDRCR